VLALATAYFQTAADLFKSGRYNLSTAVARGGEGVMSKGMERKKETKKKPAKTKEEKRAEKKAKKG